MPCSSGSTQAQPGGAGLVRLLPTRGVLRNLRLPRPLPVVPGLALAAPQTPQGHLEADPPPLLPRRIMAGQPRPDTAQPHHGRHQPLPLPGRSHPGPLASRRITHHGAPPWTYGEPVAVKAARRVREAVRGNGPVERPAPRLGPTSQRAPATPITRPGGATPTAVHAMPDGGHRRPATRPSRRLASRASAGRSTSTESRAPPAADNEGGCAAG